MRIIAWLPLFAACSADDPDCGSGEHEEGGACVPDLGDDDDDTDDTDDPGPVGNDVDLDRYPPVVVATTPASGTLGLDPATARMEVTFSKQMSTTSWSWPMINGTAPDYTAAEASFDDVDTASIDGMLLEADRGYQAWVNDPFGTYSSFVDPGGQPALPYPIVFATGSDASLIADYVAAVVGSVPMAGADDVDPTLTRIEVVFGKDMDPGAMGFAKDTAPTWPEVVSEGFSDPRTAFLEVVLEPSTTYAIRVDGFSDTDVVPAAPWLLTFRTRD